jgi:hypothetical protein
VDEAGRVLARNLDSGEKLKQAAWKTRIWRSDVNRENAGDQEIFSLDGMITAPNSKQEEG